MTKVNQEVKEVKKVDLTNVKEKKPKSAKFYERFVSIKEYNKVVDERNKAIEERNKVIAERNKAYDSLTEARNTVNTVRGINNQLKDEVTGCLSTIKQLHAAYITVIGIFVIALAGVITYYNW